MPSLRSPTKSGLLPFDLPERGVLGQRPDPAPVVFLHEPVAQILVETAQQLLSAMTRVVSAPSPGENPGELHRDIATAGDQDPARQLGQVKRVVGGDHVLAAHDTRVDVWGGSGRNENDPRSHGSVLSDEPDRMRIGDVGPLVKNRDARLLQIAAVDALQPRDLAILAFDKLSPVEPCLANGPAEARRILEVVGKPAGIDQQLLWHAPPDDAGAAHPELLGDRHPRAVPRRNARRPHPTRAAADHEQVEVVFGH